MRWRAAQARARRPARAPRGTGRATALALIGALAFGACGSVEDDEPGETIASTTSTTTSTIAAPSGPTGPDGPRPDRGTDRDGGEPRQGPSFRSAAQEICARSADGLRGKGAPASTREIVEELAGFSADLRAIDPPASFEPTLDSIDSLVADARRDPKGTIGADANLASLTVRLTAISTGFKRAGLADCGA